MIGYVTVGTNDLPSAAKFYDALAAEMGTGRMMEFETFIAWGTPGGGCGIAATKPYDGQAATVGNGVMVALGVNDNTGAKGTKKETNTPNVKPTDWREGVVTSPHGITFDNDGNILETEWNKWGRVLRWNKK